MAAKINVIEQALRDLADLRFRMFVKERQLRILAEARAARCEQAIAEFQTEQIVAEQKRREAEYDAADDDFFINDEEAKEIDKGAA